MEIYCGNLPFICSESDVAVLFRPFGILARTTVVRDKFTGKSRGFAFVTIEDEDNARAAILALNGSEYRGRVLKVGPAKPEREFG
jgi:RNA recognition motif-containing protein